MRDPSFHRPAPWFVVKNGKQTDIHCRVKPDGEAPREFTVAANINEDDAAFIVRACNSHDALVAACRDVLASGCWAYLQAGEDLRLRIESALAAAEGKAVSP